MIEKDEVVEKGLVRTSSQDLKEMLVNSQKCIDQNSMEEAGRMIEKLVNYLKAEGGVSREDIKDTLGLENEQIECLLKLESWLQIRE